MSETSSGLLNTSFGTFVLDPRVLTLGGKFFLENGRFLPTILCFVRNFCSRHICVWRAAGTGGLDVERRVSFTALGIFFFATLTGETMKSFNFARFARNCKTPLGMEGGWKRWVFAQYTVFARNFRYRHPSGF